jgi:hypothetical protein
VQEVRESLLSYRTASGRFDLCHLLHVSPIPVAHEAICCS